MRIFISSVIRGFDELRAAATAAIGSLGHHVIRAEDFAASPASPRIACLAGVREADAVVLILGASYGSIQPSGRSATHEEFEEARRTKPIFVLIQSGISPEPEQAAFIAEVQAWSTGSFTATFSHAAQLRSVLTTALHRWELSSATGKIDPDEMGARALAFLPEEDRRYSRSRPSIAIAVVGAPRQTILRPSELEAPAFRREIIQRGLFGDPSIFSTGEGTETAIEGHTLVFHQEKSSLTISEDGSLRISVGLPELEQSLPVIIHEDVHELVSTILRFSAQVLDRVDSTERLSHIALAATVINSGYLGWRTRREHQQSPNSVSMSRGFGHEIPRITLSPPHRSRAALRLQHEEMAQDIAVLLRREFTN